MKKLLLVLITFSISLGVDAQVYMRTHKNIGIYGQVNTPDFDKNGNYSFQTGITRQFGRYLLPNSDTGKWYKMKLTVRFS